MRWVIMMCCVLHNTREVIQKFQGKNLYAKYIIEKLLKSNIDVVSYYNNKRHDYGFSCSSNNSSNNNNNNTNIHNKYTHNNNSINVFILVLLR